MNPKDDTLEPCAYAEHLTLNEQVSLSMAASQKRIADALDELNLFLKAVDAAYGPLVQR